MPKTRTTSMERITDPIAEAGRDSIDDVRAEAAGPSLIKLTLLSIAAKAFADWMKNLTSCGTQRLRASTAVRTRFNL